MFDTPVVLIIFRRPNETMKVFEAIRQIQPRTLFIVADGPRTEEERPLCEAARDVVASVDWPCEVKRNYADRNMGLRKRVESGLDWVFEQTDQAIILEDDCVPDLTFFRFCAELLELYKDNPLIMHISGNYLLHSAPRLQSNYYFTRYAHIWGWATWRRAWVLYDRELKNWHDLSKRRIFLDSFRQPRERAFWDHIMNAIDNGSINSWGYIWAFSCMVHQRLCINPTVNLVRNVGFGVGATHTNAVVKNAPWTISREMVFPLIHPSSIQAEIGLDIQVGKRYFYAPSLYRKLLSPVKRRLKRFLIGRDQL